MKELQQLLKALDQCADNQKALSDNQIESQKAIVHLADCIKNLDERLKDVESQLEAPHRAKYFGQLPNMN